MPLAEIFSLYGQSGYRAIEKRTLQRILKEPRPAVLSIGGGVVSEKETYDFLCPLLHRVGQGAAGRAHVPRYRPGRSSTMAGATRRWTTCENFGSPRTAVSKSGYGSRHFGQFVEQSFSRLRAALQTHCSRRILWTLLQRRSLRERPKRSIFNRSFALQTLAALFDGPVATLTMDVAEDGESGPVTN